jgi:hypothetical protein
MYLTKYSQLNSREHRLIFEIHENSPVKISIHRVVEFYFQLHPLCYSNSSFYHKHAMHVIGTVLSISFTIMKGKRNGHTCPYHIFHYYY